MGGSLDGLSKEGAVRVDREKDFRVSPIVALELQALVETGRLKITPDQIFARLLVNIGLRVCDLPFEIVARKAFDVNWTRDPWDRLIVAHALANDAPLLTRDRLILQRYARAFC